MQQDGFSPKVTKTKLFLENLRNRVRETLQFFQSIKEPFGAKGAIDVRYY